VAQQLPQLLNQNQSFQKNRKDQKKQQGFQTILIQRAKLMLRHPVLKSFGTSAQTQSSQAQMKQRQQLHSSMFLKDATNNVMQFW
jgi:hypothetical protein